GDSASPVIPPPAASTGTWAISTGSAFGCTCRILPVERSATRALCPSGSTAMAPTGARQVATTAGSGSVHPTGCCGSCGRGDPLGGGGDWPSIEGSGPACASKDGWSSHWAGCSSGNCAQPASSAQIMVLAAAERRFQLRLAVTFPESTWCL